MRHLSISLILSALAPVSAFAQEMTTPAPAPQPATAVEATAAPAPAPAPAATVPPTSEAQPLAPSPVVAPLPPPVTTQEAPITPSAPRGPQKQASLYLGSPIWLSDAPLDAGFEVEMRSGLKIKTWVPEIGIGARWNWFNVDKVKQQYPDINAPNLFAGENLTGMWFSLGVRYEPEMKSAKIQPYVSVAFDANLWGFSYETTQVCGIWSCGTIRQYDFAPGFSSRIGVRIQPKPGIGIDLGAKPAMSFQGWAFEGTQAWIEPYAGLTILMGPSK